VRVATYTRISTDEENQPYSLGAQDDRLGAYIRSQDGWEPDEATDRIDFVRLDREEGRSKPVRTAWMPRGSRRRRQPRQGHI
jgi:DNA invertase Pin-like site-specific DNA recombinase